MSHLTFMLGAFLIAAQGMHSEAHVGSLHIRMQHEKGFLRQEQGMDEQASAVAKKGRVLFGSLTSPRDWVAVDQMLQHQLRESASSIPDHRILYIGGVGDADDNPPTAEKRLSHTAMVERVQSAHLVDEVVNLKEVNFLPLAKGVMDDEAANALDKGMDYNKAMVAFLAKCLDGYDHCAWLDGDIFVHRGTVPWIDNALQRHIEDPQIIWSMPQAIGHASHPDETHRFNTRWFIYHREGLQRFLPLKAPAKIGHRHHREVNTMASFKFEDLMHHNAPDVLESSRGGSWVAHPPEALEENTWRWSDFMETCGPQSLSTMISIVEQGSERGEMAVEWSDKSEDMDAASWMVHIQDAMRPQCSNQRLLEKVNGAEAAFRGNQAQVKTDPVKLPEQGYEGKGVKHENMNSITKDWGTEYGPTTHAPIHSFGARSAGVSIIALVTLVTMW